MKNHSLLDLAKVGLFLSLEVPVRPRWAYYRARGYAYHHLFDRFHRERFGEYDRHVRPLHEALAHVLDRDEDEVRAADDSELIRSMVVHGRWVVAYGDSDAHPDPTSDNGGPIETRYGPSPELVRLANLTARLLGPEVVVETGVARGFTTTSTLEALERNGRGHLFSVEMPGLYRGYEDQVGEIVPERLRSRWTLELGPSAIAMQRVGERVGKIDLFIHDSANNYDTQTTEYRLALEHMPAGSVIVSDMLMTDAFLETAESIDCRWAVVEQSKDFPIGLLRTLS